MERPRDPDSGPKTLGWHLRRAWRERNSWRPTSFYLLMAIPVVLILAVPAFSLRENPRSLALTLALLFAFLFLIIWLAVVDVVEISRRHSRERAKAFRKALGEDEAVDCEHGDPPRES